MKRENKVKNYSKFKIESNKEDHLLRYQIVHAINEISNDRKNVVVLQNAGNLIFIVEIANRNFPKRENAMYDHFKSIENQFECSLNISSLNHELLKQELVKCLKEGWRVLDYPKLGIGMPFMITF
jgi:hypothetical protein